MNQAMVIGRLVRDPDVRYNEEHKALARFTVAVDRYNKDKKDADYIPCTAFGKTAEIVEKYCLKGKQVGVTGSLKTGKYEKEGQTHYTMEIYVDRLDLLGSSEAKPEEPAVEYKQEELKYEAPIKGFEQADDLPF